MIASVRGTVSAVSLSTAVVEVGGIGIEMLCTPNTLATLRPGEEAHLPTSLVVREDSLTLFGFTDTDERTLFELLQTASGVGPKLAQAMLAVLSPDGIRLAISSEDTKTLTKVPGIGQKGAQRVILELKDRVGAPAGTAAAPAPTAASAPWRDQVSEALVGLGYSAKDADKAVTAIEPEAGDQANISLLLRAALRTLSKA
ncbi:Holliday junction DNA helicase subunit RuvA [Nocardioides albertanoniae]|uniref:Holliday junction branch migration complex subunit RuvA n=1 Tax=Nocardioides albertanoniae TaxID=1175486 RepID=A0A543A6Y9_9ACTN|nr:Holliday junction branch migration protein RuvA [Nocardioides albertanoniae]TQL68279.1 Holliday junction DNA helicase subunit RuvA [Nocardioides albertanoniae]